MYLQISIFLFVLVGTLDSTDGLERGLDIRRYDQFEAMAQVFDPTFDNKIITDYGCNCPALGDRPLSDPGKGAPVDALDKVCQKFKRCTKCAKMEFGEECISEMVSNLIFMRNFKRVYYDTRKSRVKHCRCS